MGRPTFRDKAAAKARAEAEALEAARHPAISAQVRDPSPGVRKNVAKPIPIEVAEPIVDVSDSRQVVVGIRPPGSSLAQHKDKRKDKGKARSKISPSRKRVAPSKGKGPTDEPVAKRQHRDTQSRATLNWRLPPPLLSTLHPRHFIMMPPVWHRYFQGFYTQATISPSEHFKQKSSLCRHVPSRG